MLGCLNLILFVFRRDKLCCRDIAEALSVRFLFFE